MRKAFVVEDLENSLGRILEVEPPCRVVNPV